MNCYLKCAFSVHCERHESNSTISDLHWQQQNNMLLLEEKDIRQTFQIFKIWINITKLH